MVLRVPFLKRIWGLVFILILVQCGQRSAPSGGERDETPPEVKKRVPEQNATNFKGKRIELRFDEYVQISGFYNEFLISPPVKTRPNYKLIGKTLTIEFDTLFNPATTYSIFLGNSVKDLNEGNAITDNLIVFSTGDFIDSLTFHGEIVSAVDLKPLNSGMVHLYKSLSDSIPALDIPSYFAKVKDGHFHFQNLAEGRYKLFALEDNNGNYLYDLPEENIAFFDEVVVINAASKIDEANEIVLKSFKASADKQYLTSKEVLFNGKFEFTFNLPVDSFKVSPLFTDFSKAKPILQWNESRDSLILWTNDFVSQDSVLFQLSYDEQIDTVKFNLKRKKSIASQKVYFEHNYTGIFNFNKKSFVIFPTQPIAFFDSSKVFYKSMNDSGFVSLVFDPVGGLSAQLNKQINPGEINELVLLPNAYKSIFGVTNTDTVRISFAATASDKVSALKLEYNFEAVEGAGFLEVYQGDVLFRKEFISAKKGALFMEGIQPGDYKLKYVADADENGNWTPGDYWNKKQPEKVFWYAEPINLRANWDIDLNWTLIP